MSAPNIGPTQGSHTSPTKGTDKLRPNLPESKVSLNQKCINVTDYRLKSFNMLSGSIPDSALVIEILKIYSLSVVLRSAMKLDASGATNSVLSFLND
jgi:hypothetical protein